MLKPTDTFFAVTKDTGKRMNFKVRHPDVDTATNEAKRLATAFGGEFLVLQCIGVVKAPKVFKVKNG